MKNPCFIFKWSVLISNYMHKHEEIPNYIGIGIIILISILQIAGIIGGYIAGQTSSARTIFTAGFHEEFKIMLFIMCIIAILYTFREIHNWWDKNLQYTRLWDKDRKH